jgi:UDP-N-acetylmuramate-alanine ligase
VRWGLRHMTYLTHEQQIFVLHQIRNWVCGRHMVFNALNAAWATHGAEAYFWN